MDQKTQEILEKATQVFLRFGIKSITMDDIARELGISKKTLYLHVKDKNDLVNQIITCKTFMDQEMCCIAQKQAENAIDEFIRTREFVLENIRMINPSLFLDLKKYHSEAWSIIEKHKHDFIYQSITKNLTRGISEGIYRDDINIEVVTILILNSTEIMMEGKLMAWPNQKIEDVFSVMTRFQLRGLVNDKGLELLNKYIKEQ